MPEGSTSFGPILAERGRSGLRESGGYVYEEFISKLRWPYAGEVYQEMSSNDPVITAVLFAVACLSVRSSGMLKRALTCPQMWSVQLL